MLTPPIPQFINAHLPTNTVVQSQDQRSPDSEPRGLYADASCSLLYEMELERQQAEQGAERLSQIGHGARSEKIRITSHRT